LRRPKAIIGLLVLALVVVHAANYFRVGAGGLAAAIEPVIDRARELESLARPEYQDYARATLPPSEVNGDFYRLDDRLAEAKVAKAPKLEAKDTATVLYALELNDAGASGLVAPNDDVKQSLDAGMLHLTGHGGTGYLTNAVPTTVPREDIGDIVIRARASKQTRLTLGWSKERSKPATSPRPTSSMRATSCAGAWRRGMR
jgi:hypothetical protein